MTTPHARLTDPTSSERAVAAIAANDSLKNHIVYAAERLYPVWFDDTDLLTLVEEQTERRQQRNVIARSRGLMERDGVFERMGEIQRIDPPRKTVHFCLAGRSHPTLFEEHSWDITQRATSRRAEASRSRPTDSSTS